MIQYFCLSIQRHVIIIRVLHYPDGKKNALLQKRARYYNQTKMYLYPSKCSYLTGVPLPSKFLVGCIMMNNSKTLPRVHGWVVFNETLPKKAVYSTLFLYFLELLLILFLFFFADWEGGMKLTRETMNASQHGTTAHVTTHPSEWNPEFVH
jgi:hypothetical protein